MSSKGLPWGFDGGSEPVVGGFWGRFLAVVGWRGDVGLLLGLEEAQVLIGLTTFSRDGEVSATGGMSFEPVSMRTLALDGFGARGIGLTIFFPRGLGAEAFVVVDLALTFLFFKTVVEAGAVSTGGCGVSEIERST